MAAQGRRAARRGPRLQGLPAAPPTAPLTLQPARPRPPPAGVICASEQSIIVVDEVGGGGGGAGEPGGPLREHALGGACVTRAAPNRPSPAVLVPPASPPTHCPSTHPPCLPTPTQVYDAVKAELLLRGAYFLKNEEEKDKVGVGGAGGQGLVGGMRGSGGAFGQVR